MEQVSMFDGATRYTIDKPIRLIELFAGYGSQSLALKYLGVPFEHWKISEWAIKSIFAYKNVHFPNDNKDYSGNMTADDLRGYLLGKISGNYNEPLSAKQLKRKRESELREIYNAMEASHNLGSIVGVNGDDLQILDIDKFTYLLTYSFPCQDLSTAGLQKGMHDNSTRSGMLWEVERILSELWVDGKPLPQILLMENVPGVCGTGVIDDFNKWLNRLEQFGYINKYKIINATDFGIPQNRKRCFMVSILGDYYFEFPDEIPLEIRMKHILEKRVAKRYYLSDKTVESFIAETTKHQERGNGFKFSSVNIDGESHSITTKSGQRATDNFISENSQFVNVERERERERAVKLAKSGTIIKDNAEQIALTITAHDGNGLTGFAKQYNNGVAEMLTDAHWEKQ